MAEVKVFEQVVLKCDEPTANGRIYPRAVVEKAFEEYQKKVDDHAALGPVYDNHVSLKGASFLVKELKLEGDAAKVVIETLPNERGAELAKMLERKEVVFTPTGVGTVTDGLVGEDYNLRGFSIAYKEGPAVPADGSFLTARGVSEAEGAEAYRRVKQLFREKEMERTEKVVRQFIAFCEDQDDFVIGPEDAGRCYPLREPQRTTLVRDFLRKLGRGERGTRIKSKRITCDETNNPPTTCETTLQIRVEVQFEDQWDERHILDLPLDLRKLRDGELKLVPVIYRS